MKTNLNIQNDEMTRKERSEIYKIEKEKARKKQILQDPESKKQLMDFLFGKSDENPLAKN